MSVIIKENIESQNTISNDFSVLIAVYKNDDHILFRKAINSIFSNYLQPKEVVLVADGKLTGDLYHEINQYSDNKRLVFVQLEQNVGLANALNVGLSRITTQYTIRADADDINYLNRFELLLSKLKEGYQLVGSAIREVDQSGAFVAFRSCPVTEQEIRKFIKRRNPYNHMSVGFCTNTVLSVGGYPSVYLKEDYGLWAKLLAIGTRVCNIDLVLVDATAGTEMFRRRSGLKYAFSEIHLQNLLVKCGLKSYLTAIVDGVIRALIFLAPNAFREFIYLKLLRSRAHNK